MAHTFNFFEQEALPAPAISAEQAERFARERYGVEGAATELGSQQDANFLIDGPAGKYVLKVSNPAFTAADLTAQDLAAAHVAACEPGVRVPVAVPGGDGASVQPVSLEGLSTSMRLVTFLDGEILSACRYLAPAVVASLGDLAGRTSRALATFGEPVPVRALQWDLRYAEEVVTRLAEFVPDDAGSVRSVAAAAAEALAPYAGGLPTQAIHGDLTDDNVIAVLDGDGRRSPVGVIDFGDLTESWAIAELAVTCSSLLWYAEGDLTTILPAIRAFDQVRPISDDELSALWPLIVLRAASLMVSGRHQAHIDGGNTYATTNLDREWRIFERSVSVPMAVMTELIRSSLRPPAPRPAVDGWPLLPADEAAVRLDLSVTSPGLHGGRFLEEPEATGAAVAYVPFLQPRLTRTVLNSFEAPETTGLGVEVVAAEPLAVHAPWAGVLESHDDAVALRSDGPTLWLSGTGFDVADGTAVEAGDEIGLIHGPLRVQACHLRERPPFFVTAAMAEAWARVCPDPTSLIGPAPEAERTGADALLARRDSAFAPVQEHYYGEPPQIERGWRHHLFDMGGRAYLDMLNNVAILGHGHPRLSDAIEGQWRLLNTNSRFHYRAVVEFSERLASLLPDPLDTVFLVNSGIRGRRPRAAAGVGEHRPARRLGRTARPTTAGPTRPTPSRPRSPTTRTP